MKRSRYSDHQILNIFKQAEAGTPVPELYHDGAWGEISIMSPDFSDFRTTVLYRCES